MVDSPRAATVLRFYEAFNARDLDAFVATLDPHVELQTARGLRRGRDEAREWATRNPAGGLDQRLVVEELREAGNHVVALYRKQWWWREEGELALVDEMAALFSFAGDLITRWQPFEDRAEALELLDELADRA